MMVTVTETCSELYIIDYIVVFWLNDILVTLKFTDNYSFFFFLPKRWFDNFDNEKRKKKSAINKSNILWGNF